MYAKLTVALDDGIKNLSVGVKDVLVCACTLGLIHKQIKIMRIMAITAETLLLIVLNLN